MNWDGVGQVVAVLFTQRVEVTLGHVPIDLGAKIQPVQDEIEPAPLRAHYQRRGRSACANGLVERIH